MAEELPPLIVTVLGDASNALGMLDDLEARLAAFARQDFTANISGNPDQLDETIAAAEAALAALGADTTTVDIDGDDTGLEDAIARAQIALLALSKEITTLPIDADDKPFLENLAALRAVVAGENVDIPINIKNLTQVKSEILQLRGALADLKTDAVISGAEIAAMAESDLMSWDEVNSAIRSAMEASIAADALTDAAALRIMGSGLGGGGGGGGGGGSAPAAASGWENFLGTFFGAKGGRGKRALGFSDPLLPKIPIAGFGTLGSMAGLGLESIVGLGAGVAGSAVHAGLGGAALGITSAAVTATGMGTDMAGLGQASGDIKQYGQLQANLKQTAAVYGKSSTEYAAAMYAYQQWSSTLSKGYIQALATASGTKTAFQAMFDSVTSKAATTGAQIINQTMQVGMKFLPTIGKFAAENMTIIQKSLQPLFSWLTGPGLTAFNQIEQVFTDHLPTAMHAFDQGVELAIRTIAHFAPQTGGLIKFLDNLFTKLNGPGFDKFIGQVQGAIDAFHVWESFFKSIGKAIYELFHNDAGTGEAFIVTLTTLINKFNTWAQTVAGGDQLHSYMEAHKKEVEQLVGLFGNLVTIMGQVHLAAGPALMDIVGDLVKFVNLLLQIPGVGKILSYGIAFEILGRHVRILKPLVEGFNTALKNLAEMVLSKLGVAVSALGGPFQKLGGWLSGLGTTGPTDIQLASDAMNNAATSMEGAATRIEAAFANIGTSAEGMAGDVDLATANIDGALATTAGDAEASAARVDGALATEGLSGDVGGAGLAAGGLAGKAGTAGEAATEDAVGEGIAASFLKGSVAKGIGGLIAVQLYNAFAEKPLAKVIGKNAASALGDAGTGAAIGFTVAGPWGAAAGAAMGIAFAERSGITKFLGSVFTTGKPGSTKPLDPSFPHSSPGLGTNTPGQAPGGRVLPTARPPGYNPKFPFATPGAGPSYAPAPHPTTTQTQLAKDSTLQKQLNVMQILEWNANTAKTQDGANSAQYKAALKALQTTEQKYFPGLGKNESLTGINTKLTTLYGKILDLKAAQHADQTYGNDQLKGAKANLDLMKSDLQADKTGRASKDAIDQAKEAVNDAKKHVDDVKHVIDDGNNIGKQIKTDTANMKKLEDIKGIMTKVNTDTTSLNHSVSGAGINIAKLPQTTWKTEGNIKLVIS